MLFSFMYIRFCWMHKILFSFFKTNLCRPIHVTCLNHVRFHLLVIISLLNLCIFVVVFLLWQFTIYDKTYYNKTYYNKTIIWSIFSINGWVLPFPYLSETTDVFFFLLILHVHTFSNRGLVLFLLIHVKERKPYLTFCDCCHEYLQLKSL